VFYDSVQYDKHGWRNRNRIKTAQGVSWLTIPVLSRGSTVEGTPIREIRIDWTQRWERKHLATLRQSYARAPYLDKYLPLLESHLLRRDEFLADLLTDLTQALSIELGIRDTRFVRSSEIEADGDKTDRLVQILETLGVTHYISGPAAKGYLEEERLHSAGITLEYMEYDYPEYEQLHPPYDPQVSILDLLFAQGPKAGAYIWGTADGLGNAGGLESV
jgi:hypothetical protein